MARTLFCILLFLPVLSQAQQQRGKFIQSFLVKRLDQNAAPNTGPAPDYSNDFFWAATPFRHDTSDSIPSFIKNEIRDSVADVFFIHPTSFLGGNFTSGTELEEADNRTEAIAAVEKAAWNADLTDSFLNQQTDTRTILYQASVFNASCRIFAPRYRQANIKAFFVRNTPRAQQAFDLAYGDVKKAFQYYLDHYNHGRPVIIASHSQGSLHAIRLLQEFFDGTPLQKQLVCAYVVGYHIPVDAFKHLPIGNTPTAIGCVVGWRSFQKGDTPKNITPENGNSVCVNPLTWTAATDWAPKENNHGTMITFNTLFPQTVSAGIDPAAKILFVTLPPDTPPQIKKMQNLHVLDYNLFWVNIRENVRQRIAAWQQQQH